ncbi:MAG TPA: hypothetical protein VD867_08050, partial [Burkholderiales bacterium]|nr:hypothetical protein [Burkholderiales bacterium]
AHSRVIRSSIIGASASNFLRIRSSCVRPHETLDTGVSFPLFSREPLRKRILDALREDSSSLRWQRVSR